MFAIEQINDLHVRLGSARTFPDYVRALKTLGVERYDSYLADGHSEYEGQGGHRVVSPPGHECFPLLKVVNARRSSSTCAGTSGARGRT
jgi:Protein of unknown function (DUF1398)